METLPKEPLRYNYMLIIITKKVKNLGQLDGNSLVGQWADAVVFQQHLPQQAVVVP